MDNKKYMKKLCNSTSVIAKLRSVKLMPMPLWLRVWWSKSWVNYPTITSPCADSCRLSSWPHKRPKRYDDNFLGMEKKPRFFQNPGSGSNPGFNLNYSGFFRFLLVPNKTTCYLVNTGMCHSLTMNLIKGI